LSTGNSECKGSERAAAVKEEGSHGRVVMVHYHRIITGENYIPGFFRKDLILCLSFIQSRHVHDSKRTRANNRGSQFANPMKNPMAPLIFFQPIRSQ
jgi:hypothetical protein